MFSSLARNAGRLAASTLLAAGVIVATQAAPASARIHTIRPGDSGSEVVIWQKDLNFFMSKEHTCRPTLTVDGDFGAKTTNATRCVQRYFHIDDDAIVGDRTRYEMCNFLQDFNATGLYDDTCNGA